MCSVFSEWTQVSRDLEKEFCGKVSVLYVTNEIRGQCTLNTTLISLQNIDCLCGTNYRTSAIYRELPDLLQTYLQHLYFLLKTFAPSHRTSAPLRPLRPLCRTLICPLERQSPLQNSDSLSRHSVTSGRALVLFGDILRQVWCSKVHLRSDGIPARPTQRFPFRTSISSAELSFILWTVESICGSSDAFPGPPTAALAFESASALIQNLRPPTTTFPLQNISFPMGNSNLPEGRLLAPKNLHHLCGTS